MAHDKSSALRHDAPDSFCMPTKLSIVASLFIHPGHEAEFEQFETAAESIMQRYGGRIERRIGFAAGADTGQPHEVHLVTFPDQQAFDRYRADADLQALADLRTRAIRQTTAWIGSDLGSFIKV
jgi:uncharacterized protein (DUF1330 family)